MIKMFESKIKGYAGKFLRVDLTLEHLSDVFFDEETLRKFVGGTGIGTKILYEEVLPELSWSDPENRITIASGPLGGTSVPGSGTISLVTKGTLTNGATSTQANGFFGTFLKFSGYDGVIIQGAAKRWLYLHIEDGKAELKDANYLLGMNNYEVVDTIRQEMGKREREMSILSIGPAGEHLVRFSGILVDKGHSMSRNGSGAVMGSKKLKAIAVVRGKGKISVNDRERLRRVKTHGGIKTIGTTYTLYKQAKGKLPIQNYATNIWQINDEKAEKFSEEYINKYVERKPGPCWACSCNHCNMMTIPEGPYKGLVVEEPEYEQMAAMGPVIGNKEAFSAFMLARTCDELGIENSETGWLVGWVMECYEKGYLTKEDLGGLEMEWGNVEAVKKLFNMIANRQGIGDLLAEGVMRASQKIGGEAAKCAIYTMKGNTPRTYDHRSEWGELFDTVVSNTSTIETHYSRMDEKARMPGYAIESSTQVALTKGLMAIEDSVGTCRFQTMMNATSISEAVSAVTGWDFTPEEAKAVGVRIVNMMRVYNIRCGIKKEHDYPSERYGSTPVDGPSKGIAVMPYWDEMLDNYYTLMGWDVETGKPLPETLKNLGLEHIIKDIW